MGWGHIWKYSGEKSNKCNQCNYASSQKSNLRTHLKSLSGEKSKKCNLCDYASSHAGHLRTHLKLHSGVKPMWLHLPMHLIWGHIWRHTSEKSRTNASNVIMLSLRQAISVDIWKCTVEKKSHKCKQCDYAFSQAGNLRKHSKTHSREKSNKCDQCDYASYHAGHLRTHLEIHNWEKSRKRNRFASSYANNWRCF